MLLYCRTKDYKDGKELFMKLLMLLQLMNDRLLRDFRLLSEKLVRDIRVWVLKCREVMLEKLLFSNNSRLFKSDTFSV
jgi:hypothetical protein